jgi:iron complex outermembrane receptor protein
MSSYRSSARLMCGSALTGSLLAAALAFAAPAFAADAVADAAAAAPDAGPKVDEIVVTGALRSQRLQDAPMAVTAVTSEEFTNAGYKSPVDLQFLSPSVQVSVQGANAIYIRGSGTNNTNGSGEQSVGLVIDGVLIGFTDDIGGDISDLDHTEVYRGPQGTQFAMNTSAGAVAILTKKPQIGVTSTDVHLSYGEHNDTADYITQNVPLGPDLAARLTASFQHRDGVFDNTSLDREAGGRQQAAFRGKLLWNPSDKITVLFNADVRKTDEFPNFPQAWGACGPGITESFPTIYGGNTLPPCNGALIAGGAGAPSTGLVPSPTNSTSTEDQKAYRHTETGGASATINYLLGDFTLTSITAYRFMSRRVHGPIGSGYVSAFYLDDWYNGSQTSQELRISSPAEKKLTYVAGLFFYDRNTLEKGLFAGSNYGMAQDFYPNTPYGKNVRISFDGGEDRTHNDNKSYAAYTDGSYHITDKLQINAGGRITRDDIFASVNTVAVPGVYPAFGATKAPGQLELMNTGYTWRLGPQYFITPDIQVYGTWAHGYKGPLIDASVAVLNPVKPEENMMLEAGIKSSWFDHRLTVDLTAFHEKYTNYQISVLNQSVTPNVFQLGNAGGMLAQGFELEMNARPTQDWRFQAGLSLDDNHYTDFNTSCWNALEPIKQATSGLNGCYVHPGATAAAAQAKGTPLVNSSKYTYRLGGTYTHELASRWRVDANATYLWRSQFLSAPMDPNLINPGYGILNLDAGVTSPSGYRFGIFARNGLDTFFVAGRQAGNGGYTNVLNTEAVRTVGVSLDLKFE